MELTNRLARIAGGTWRIGRATATRCIRIGALVVLIVRYRSRANAIDARLGALTPRSTSAAAAPAPDGGNPLAKRRVSNAQAQQPERAPVRQPERTSVRSTPRPTADTAAPPPPPPFTVVSRKDAAVGATLRRPDGADGADRADRQRRHGAGAGASSQVGGPHAHASPGPRPLRLAGPHVVDPGLDDTHVDEDDGKPIGEMLDDLEDRVDVLESQMDELEYQVEAIERVERANAAPRTAADGLDNLALQESTRTCLRWNNITSIPQVTQLAWNDVIKLRGMDLRSMNDLHRALAEQGLAFAHDPRDGPEEQHSASG